MQGQGLSQATEACDAQSLLQSISEVATQLGIVGTPTLIREDGVILKGVTNLDALQSWVGAVSPVSPVAPTVTANQEIQP
jgi:protein-disulfide isomerase